MCPYHATFGDTSKIPISYTLEGILKHAIIKVQHIMNRRTLSNGPVIFSYAQRTKRAVFYLYDNI